MILNSITNSKAHVVAFTARAVMMLFIFYKYISSRRFSISVKIGEKPDQLQLKQELTN